MIVALLLSNVDVWVLAMTSVFALGIADRYSESTLSSPKSSCIAFMY